MSSIQFDASLNTQKLDDGIRESNKTVGEWAKGVEAAGNKADQGLNKMTKSFKDAITEQKALIKSIEADIKKLEKAYDEAGAGKGKQAAWRELQGAKKALAEEQGTLLGLQKQQIEANTKEESSQNRLIGTIGKWAAGLFTVGAALKITKSIIASTETTAHTFERTIAGATSGIGYFFKAIASGDWENFWQGLNRAIKGAQEFVDEMEVIQNKLNEQKVKSSKIDKDIAELRDKTYDKDKSNNEARKQALESIVKLQAEKYTKEAALAKETYDLNLKKAASDSGLAKEQIENFINEYNSLEKLIEQGKKYNELKKKYFLGGPDIEDTKKQIDLMGQAGEEAGKYVMQIGKIKMETRKMLSDSEAAAYEAEAAFGQKNRRDKMQLAEVTNKIREESETAIKQAIEAAKLENQLKKQTELLNKAIQDGNIEEIKAIAEKVAALKEELALREKIAANAILVAQLGDMSNITPLQGKLDLGTGIVLPKAKPKKTKTWAEFQSEVAAGGGLTDPSKQYEKNLKAAEKIGKTITEQDEKRAKLQQEILQAVTEVTLQLGQQLGIDEKSMSFMAGSLDAITQAASGDFVGAAASMLSGIIAMIPNEAAKFAAQIENINRLIEEQQRLISISERKGGEQEVLQKTLSLAEEKLAMTEAALEQAEYKLRHSQGGIFLGKRKKAVEELTIAANEARIAVEDAQQTLTDFLVGGVTENNIADMIAQGFQEGKTSIDDFADYMNNVLTDAVLNIFKAEILGPEITKLTELTKKALADKVLTPAEKTELDKKVKEIADNNKKLWDDLTSSLNMPGSTSPGLSGGIQRTITEETGTELAGLMRRISDDVRGNRDYNKLGISHLVGIENNTFQTVVQLQLAVIELKNIVNNTKPLYIGTL